MYYVYILTSIRYRKTYVGITDNVDRRIKDHNTGKSAFTKRFRPWTLLSCEQLISYGQARKREKYYKSGAGRRKIAQLINHHSEVV